MSILINELLSDSLDNRINDIKYISIKARMNIFVV